MFLALTSWIIIIFILFSFGDFFISLYNKSGEKKESYTLIDIFILGLCFLTVIVTLSSLWLPINQYVLLAFLFISIIYWIVRRKKLIHHINLFSRSLKDLSRIQFYLLVFGFLSVLTSILVFSTNFDSAYYYHQNIKWNEDFSVVPGLANLEDRFGFNSSYFLISSLFSFRFIFGEAIYPIQSVLAGLIMGWILLRIYRSGYDINYLLLLAVFCLLLFLDWSMLGNTSTDIIPTLLLFYFISKTISAPDWFQKQSLMAFCVPVTLITYKLSVAPFCLISLYVIYQLFKDKKTRPILFLLSYSSILIGFWLVRNVIVSGYLIYPLYQIDLFSFDWKVPECTAILQSEHINKWAVYSFKKHIIERIFSNPFNVPIRPLLYSIINFLVFLISIFSLLLILYTRRKKTSKYDKNIYSIWLISYICLIFGLLSAPDLRFTHGFMFGILFLSLFMTVNTLFPQKQIFNKSGNFIILVFIIIPYFQFFTASRMNYYFNYKYDNKTGKIKHLLLYPKMPKNYSGECDSITYKEYKMNNLTVYITSDPSSRTYDNLPATDMDGLPFYNFTKNKIQNIQTIEPRGKSLQDGFRTKKEFITILNENKNLYKSEYLRLKYKIND